MSLDEKAAKRLDAIHEDAKLSEAANRMKSGWYAKGPYTCIAPGTETTADGKGVCGNRILKPRMVKPKDGKRYVTLVYCSQECHDRYMAQFHIPGPHWEKLDQEGNLIGYVLPRRGFVPLEEVERERDEERDNDPDILTSEETDRETREGC